MLIAENLHPAAMSGSNIFCDKLSEVVKVYDCRKVIETGTYLGEGTTTAVLKSLMPEGKMISIEVNPKYHKIAKAKLSHHRNLRLWNGLSIAHPQSPVDTTFEGLPSHIVVDYPDEHRKDLYHKEINFNVPDNLLDKALSEFDYCPDLVILDSAGHIGLIEFMYLWKRLKAPCLLALDDITHVKHARSMAFIEQYPQYFQLLWKREGQTITGDDNDHFGSALIRITTVGGDLQQEAS